MRKAEHTPWDPGVFSRVSWQKCKLTSGCLPGQRQEQTYSSPGLANRSRCTGRLVTKHLVFLSKGQDQCLHAFQSMLCVCVYIYICTPFHASHENEVYNISNISYICMYPYSCNYLGHTDILKFVFVSCMGWLPS